MEVGGIPAIPLIFYPNARPSFSQTLNILKGELKSVFGGPLGLHAVLFSCSDPTFRKNALPPSTVTEFGSGRCQKSMKEETFRLSTKVSCILVTQDYGKRKMWQYKPSIKCGVNSQKTTTFATHALET
jgi:hypothetical protein